VFKSPEISPTISDLSEYDVSSWTESRKYCKIRRLNRCRCHSKIRGTVLQIYGLFYARVQRTSYSRPRETVEGWLRAGHRSISIELSALWVVWSARVRSGLAVGAALITARLVGRSSSVVSSAGDNRSDNLISAGAMKPKAGKTGPRWASGSGQVVWRSGNAVDAWNATLWEPAWQQRTVRG